MIGRIAIGLALALLPVAAQDVDQIVAKAIAARGGAERIKAIKTQRLTGRISIASDAPGAFTVEIRRPGAIREEFTAGGSKIARWTDGKAGWVRVGEGAPTEIPTLDVKSLSASADLDGPFVDYKERGTQIAYAGTADVEGHKAYKLIITPKDGPVRTAYIDAQTYFETKWESTINADGRELAVESFFRDYRDVDGVKCAYRIDSNTLGTPIKQKIVFERIEINPPIDNARFTNP